MKNSSHCSTDVPTILPPDIIAQMERDFRVCMGRQNDDVVLVQGMFVETRWGAVVFILGSRKEKPYWVVERIDFRSDERAEAIRSLKRAKATALAWLNERQAQPLGGLS